MKAYIGITDYDWFRSLSSIPGIDEVNFWQPSGNSKFRALNPGELFLFKLHSPKNFIVGGGFFAYSTIIPVSLAWESFAEKNGAANLMELKSRIKQFRRDTLPAHTDYNIGCILLEQPFFFARKDWIPVPRGWSPNIVRGKTYDLTDSAGRELWSEIQFRIQSGSVDDLRPGEIISEQRLGPPMTIQPRLGQGSFRVMVTDAYHRRCAVTRERTLPALEAAHIKPFKDEGPNRVDNGLLLRSDIHRLFDSGYVTLTPNYRFEVSRRIKEEYENGRDYYAFNGRQIELPGQNQFLPSVDFLRWHNEKVYRSC
jgi:putative restriction endonuclease